MKFLKNLHRPFFDRSPVFLEESQDKTIGTRSLISIHIRNGWGHFLLIQYPLKKYGTILTENEVADVIVYYYEKTV